MFNLINGIWKIIYNNYIDILENNEKSLLEFRFIFVNSIILSIDYYKFKNHFVFLEKI